MQNTLYAIAPKKSIVFFEKFFLFYGAFSECFAQLIDGFFQLNDTVVDASVLITPLTEKTV